MNFRKLPKEKRNHLILVVLVTLIAVAGLYFGLIRRQNESLARLARTKGRGRPEAPSSCSTPSTAPSRIKAELDAAKTTLAAAESDVASGDLYAWVINSLRQFKAPYKVEIPQFSQLGAPVDVNLLPSFPYKQATLTVAGTAHFHDLGRFLADFENQFPHVRLLNLSLDANAPSLNAEPETLSFKMDIVTLVKAQPVLNLSCALCRLRALRPAPGRSRSQPSCSAWPRRSAPPDRRAQPPQAAPMPRPPSPNLPSPSSSTRPLRRRAETPSSRMSTRRTKPPPWSPTANAPARGHRGVGAQGDLRHGGPPPGHHQQPHFRSRRRRHRRSPTSGRVRITCKEISDDSVRVAPQRPGADLDAARDVPNDQERTLTLLPRRGSSTLPPSFSLSPPAERRQGGANAMAHKGGRGFSA